MLKSAALGASATLVATTEGHSEPTSAAPAKRPTEVVNPIGADKKPIALACIAKGQKWEYTTIDGKDLAAIKDLGTKNWEAVCMTPNNELLFKRPV
jgi:hypothetical protein